MQRKSRAVRYRRLGRVGLNKYVIDPSRKLLGTRVPLETTDVRVSINQAIALMIERQVLNSGLEIVDLEPIPWYTSVVNSCVGGRLLNH